MMSKKRIVPDELDPATRHAVNKRLTLNILIQGAASESFFDVHPSVHYDLNLLDKRFVPYYRTIGRGTNLTYWRGLLLLVTGRPFKFWNSLSSPGNVFYRHRFLRRHGKQLAISAKQHVLDRCVENGLPMSGIQNEVCMHALLTRLIRLEAPNYYFLEQLAKRVCTETFEIAPEKLNASITFSPEFGTVRQPKTRRGRMLLHLMGGWSGVERRGDELIVIAKAIFWPMLVHELIKGTMELICLHGLNDLPESEFEKVMDYTEHVEYEVPMMQIGPEIYRRFVSVLPSGLSLAQCVMKIAQLDPIDLEEFMFEMVEAPNRATDMLRAI